MKKKVRLPKELTFQDMYNNQDAFDDDDEDDSDWEPVQKHIEVVKWFCTNCTMVNLDDVFLCDVHLFILFLDTIPCPSFGMLCSKSSIVIFGIYADLWGT